MSDRRELHHIEDGFGAGKLEMTYWFNLDSLQYRVPVFVLEDMSSDYPQLVDWLNTANQLPEPPSSIFDDIREILRPAIFELQAYINF